MSDKIRYTFHFQLKMRDFSNPILERKCIAATRELLSSLTGEDYSEVSSVRPVYVPYKVWRDAGGFTNVVPDFVKIVHGLPEITMVKPEVMSVRGFLVPDQVNGYAPRIHLAKHYISGTGQVKIDVNHAFCGEHTDGEPIVPDVESVTCPECLQEIKDTNVYH